MIRDNPLIRGLALPLMLMVAALVAIERWRAEDHRYYGGQTTALSSTAAGTLQVELRSAIYERGIPRAVGGRTTLRLPRESVTRIELWLRNEGERVVTVLPRGSADDIVGTCHVLVDDLGSHYSARAAIWDRRLGEPEQNVGQVLPGWGARLALEFPGIPAKVGELTLTLDCLQADDAPLDALQLPVPLP